MSGLPPDALASVSKIEAMIAEGERLAASAPGADESAYALRETQRRYLPDTIAAYLDLPESQRDAGATDEIVRQLALLERATAQRLSELSAAGRSSLAANGAFLGERFGALETLPEAPAVTVSADAPPRALVARFFEQLGQTASADPSALVAVAAERFSRLLPRITTVKRGLFGGGPPRAVILEVPVGDHIMRYALEAGRTGVDATCTKVVRGIALRTERADIGEWLRGLFEDVGAYVERDRSTRDLLHSFFTG